MRKLLLTVGLFALAGTLFAQGQFVGTWKLNTAKNNIDNDSRKSSRAMTIVMEEQGDNLQVTSTGTNADGLPFSLKYTVPIKGGAGQVQESSGRLDGVSLKVVSANVLEITYSRGGKEALFRRVVVSKDGKTMRATEKGTNVNGKPVDASAVFKKQ
jgi:hypothetical protein